MRKILATLWLSGLAAFVLALAISFGVHAQTVTFGSPTQVLAAYNYKNITGDATTTLKSTSGVLHTITFNAPVATETVTIYDNTAGSGTKIGTITVPASPMPVTLTYDAYFAIGLTLVTATATSDVTVTWY